MSREPSWPRIPVVSFPVKRVAYMDERVGKGMTVYEGDRDVVVFIVERIGGR